MLCCVVLCCVASPPPSIEYQHKLNRIATQTPSNVLCCVVLQGFLVLGVACFMASTIKSKHKDKMVELVNALAVLTIIALGVAGGWGRGTGAGYKGRV